MVSKLINITHELRTPQETDLIGGSSHHDQNNPRSWYIPEAIYKKDLPPDEVIRQRKEARFFVNFRL